MVGYNIAKGMLESSVSKLSHMMGQSSPKRLTPDTLYDPVSRLYLTIKTMYQHYKKAHQLQIMQNHVFAFAAPARPAPRTPTPVTPALLFAQHSLGQADVLQLHDLGKCLAREQLPSFEREMLSAIGGMEEVGPMMRCYRELLNAEFARERRPKYKELERMMVQVLVERELTGKELRTVGTHILALPVIGTPILQLISRLFDKVTHLSDFNLLHKIFTANFPSQPERVHLEALLRICKPQSLAKAEELMLQGGPVAELIGELAEAEAKRQLASVAPEMSDKTRAILEFVVWVTRQGRAVWLELIEWEHGASQAPKEFLKEQLEETLVTMMESREYLEPLLPILVKITDIDEHSQIALILMRELLKTGSRQVLSQRVVRRFVAQKVIRYGSSEDYSVYSRQLFSSPAYVEIVLELFRLEGAGVFYEHLLRTDPGLVEEYLAELARRLPAKFKDFFIKAELMEREALALNKKLEEELGFELAVGVVRDLSPTPITQRVFTLFGKLLFLFREHRQAELLRLHCARALNCYLVRTPRGQISMHVKIHLPHLIKDYLLKENASIFMGVPAETTRDLKETYDQIAKKGMPLMMGLPK